MWILLKVLNELSGVMINDYLVEGRMAGLGSRRTTYPLFILPCGRVDKFVEGVLW